MSKKKKVIVSSFLDNNQSLLDIYDLENYPFLNFLDLNLVCHPNFTKKQDISILNEMFDNPHLFKYCIFLAKVAHLGILFFKGKEPYCSLGYGSKYYMNPRTSILSIPDSLLKDACVYHTKSKASVKKKMKYRSIYRSFKKNKLSDFENHDPLMIHFGQMTTQQALFLKGIFKGKKQQNFFLNHNTFSIINLKGTFSTKGTIIDEKKKNGKFINCYEFTYEFLKKGDTKAKTFHSKLFKTTKINALKHFLFLIYKKLKKKFVNDKIFKYSLSPKIKTSLKRK